MLYSFDRLSCKKIFLNIDTNKIRRCVAAVSHSIWRFGVRFGVRKSKMLHGMLCAYGKRMQQHDIDEFSLQHRCNKINMFILLHRCCNMLHGHATSCNMGGKRVQHLMEHRCIKCFIKCCIRLTSALRNKEFSVFRY